MRPKPHVRFWSRAGMATFRLRQRADSPTEPAQETLTEREGSETAMLTSLQGIATSWATRRAAASLTEEPGAGKPHAGICAGGVG